MQPIQQITIVGGGSAGLLSALTLRLAAPEAKLRLLRSANAPVIGVGESTTAAFPTFLHGALKIDRGEFYREVQPSWKLGIRFLWGDKHVPYFYYPFDSRMDYQRPELSQPDAFYCQADLRDSTPYGVLMDRSLSSVSQEPGGRHVDEGFGYHLDNRRLLQFLERKAREADVEFVEGDLEQCELNENGEIAKLHLADGRALTADLYIDCSGFQSLLLGKSIGQPYLSYADSLFCDRAVVGSFQRAGTVLPYTTAETMDHGWCWQIEFLDRVTRGYVFSSAFCDDDQAAEELRRKNPALGEDLRVVRFPSGRYENFWIGNVAAIGNAAGFVEPLEATALHLIAEQLRLLSQAIREFGNMVPAAIKQIQNARFRNMWDDVRDFLAIHYRYNHKCDSEFWQHCRRETRLHGAEQIVELYQQAGPTLWLKRLIDEESMFGYTGYVTMLMGQRVAAVNQPTISDSERLRWGAVRDSLRQSAATALDVRTAMQMISAPNWSWSSI